MNETHNFRLQRNRFLMLGALCGAMLLPSAASASLSTGTFNAVGNASISNGVIAFTNNPISPVFSVGTGDFTTLNGTVGAIQTISNVAALPMANFVTFNTLPGISFTLTSVASGSFGTAGCLVNGPCSPAGSPYNLYNLATPNGPIAVASFSVSGFETDGVHTTPFSALFSATFANQTYQNIVSEVASGNTIQTSYTASFTVPTPTPEPAFLLVPLGLGLAVMLGRSKRKSDLTV